MLVKQFGQGATVVNCLMDCLKLFLAIVLVCTKMLAPAICAAPPITLTGSPLLRALGQGEGGPRPPQRL